MWLQREWRGGTGRRLEGGVLVWDIMGENLWWVGGGLRGARGVKGPLCLVVFNRRVCNRITQARDRT